MLKTCRGIERLFNKSERNRLEEKAKRDGRNSRTLGGRGEDGRGSRAKAKMTR